MQNLLNVQKEFQNYKDINYKCPKCKLGFFVPEADTFKELEPEYSKNFRAEGFVEPEIYELQFNVTLKCNNNKCGTFSFASGERRIETHNYENECGYQVEYINIYNIDSFSPSPDLFTIPAGTPELTRQFLRTSFTLYWVDINSAASMMRTSLEKLIEAGGIQTKTKTGKFIPLHQRIENWITASPKLKELSHCIQTLKDIGNFGTHGGDVTPEKYIGCLSIYSTILQMFSVERELSNSKDIAEKINPKKVS